MKYKNVLLTGGSGKLGQAITTSGYFSSFSTPTRQILDITKPSTIKKFFDNNDFDAIIHCAALARPAECEKDPAKAIETNIIGTSNLVMFVLYKEEKLQKKIRFIHISTDAVYAGKKGNYSEKDATNPYNKYGWTKLGAECAVHLLSNFCIIRTNFFDPNNIRFDKSATDVYSSKVPINYLVKAIATMLNHNFIGTINIGGQRKSDYKRYKEFKISLKSCNFEEIANAVSFPMAHDASMDCSLWKKIEQQQK